MQKAKDRCSLWQTDLTKGRFQNVLEAFQTEASLAEWSVEEEVYCATYCIRACGVRSVSAMKNSTQLDGNALYSLMRTCYSCAVRLCGVNDEAVLMSTYNVSRYFVHARMFPELLGTIECALAYYRAMKYDEATKSSCEDLIQAYLILLLKNMNELITVAGNERKTIASFWEVAFRLSAAMRHKYYHTLIDFFTSFVCRRLPKRVEKNAVETVCVSCMETLVGWYVDDGCAVAVPQMMRSLVNLYRAMVYYLLHNSIVEKTLVRVRAITFRVRERFAEDKMVVMALDFVDYICRIAFHAHAGEDGDRLTEAVMGARRLMEEVEERSPFANELTYFASLALYKVRNHWTLRHRFAFHQLDPLFVLCSKVAVRMMTFDPNQQCSGETNSFHTLKRDFFAILYLVDNIFWLSRALATTPEEFVSVVRYVRFATDVFIECFDDVLQLDEARRRSLYIHLLTSIAAITASYIKHELIDLATEILVKVLNKLVESGTMELRNENSDLEPHLTSLLTSICHCYTFTQSFTECLQIWCIWSVVTPWLTTFCMEQYAITKWKMKHHYEQDCEDTCWDLMMDGEKVSGLNGLDYGVNDVKRILLRELRLYTCLHIDNDNVVSKILEISRDSNSFYVHEKLWLHIEGSVYFTNKANRSQHTLELLPQMKRIVSELVSDRSIDRDTVCNLCLLANFHYVKFRMELLEMREKMNEEIELFNSMKLSSSQTELGMENDPSYFGDFTPSYTNLIYDKQKELLQMLDTSLMNWQTAMANEKSFTYTMEENSIYGDMCLEFIRDTAFVYRLYYHCYKEIESWELLYKMATVLKNTSMRLFAVSYLFMTSWVANDEWINEVEELLPEVDLESQLKYKLNKSFQCFSGEKSEYYFRKFLEINTNDLDTYTHLRSKYYYLNARFQLAGLLPKNPFDAYINAFTAYSNMVNYIKDRSWNSFWETCELQSLFHEIASLNGSMYSDIYEVREASCFLKEELALSQKLCLPLKTAKVILSYSYLESKKCCLENLYLKLDCVATILKYQKPKGTAEIRHPSVPFSPIASASTHLDTRSGTCSAMIPKALHVSPVADGSSCARFVVPSFLTHASDCACTSCVDVEYARLMCDLTLLYAIYYHLSANEEYANEHFVGALDMLNICVNRYAQSRLKQEFDDMMARAKIAFADLHAFHGRLDEADVLNKRAYDHLTSWSSYVLRVELGDQRNAISCARLAKVEPAEEEAVAVCVTARKGVTTLPRAGIMPIRTPAPVTASKRIAVFEDDPMIAAMTVTPAPRRIRRALFCDADEKTPRVSPPRTARLTTRRKPKRMEGLPDLVPATVAVVRRYKENATDESAMTDDRWKRRARRRLDEIQNMDPAEGKTPVAPQTLKGLESRVKRRLPKADNVVTKAVRLKAVVPHHEP